MSLKLKFEAREVEIIQGVFSSMNNKALPADDDDLIFLNGLLLLLKKFESIRVQKNKEYTRTLFISEVNLLMQMRVVFEDDDSYSIITWDKLTNKLFKTMQEWKVQVSHYREKT